MRHTLPFVVRADEIARLEAENENLRQQIDRQMSENIRRREWERRSRMMEPWSEALMRYQEKARRRPDEEGQEEVLAAQLALTKWARSESQIAELVATMRKGALHKIASAVAEEYPTSDVALALLQGDTAALEV